MLGLNSDARCGEDYTLQKPTNIFSSDRQKQMKTEIDEGTTGGRAWAPKIIIDIPKRPDGFWSHGERHQLHSPKISQSFRDVPSLASVPLRGCLAEMHRKWSSHPVILLKVENDGKHIL